MLNDFWAYNAITDSWNQIASLPGSTRREASAFSIGNLGYAGMGSGFGVYYSDFYEYNPATNNWTLKSPFGGGVREEATQFSIGSFGYVGTGYDGTSPGVMERDFWEYRPDDPTTSVNEMFLQPEDLMIAPNPMVNETVVSLPGTAQTTLKEIRLYNIKGQRVLTRKADNAISAQIFRGNLAAGTYQLQVLLNNGQALSKPLVIR